MQVIIDITESNYSDILNNNVSPAVIWNICNAIKNGTLLPKGHWIQQPRYAGDDQPDLVCPNCGFEISWWDMGNFCAKCGKRLEGGAE